MLVELPAEPFDGYRHMPGAARFLSLDKWGRLGYRVGHVAPRPSSVRPPPQTVALANDHGLVFFWFWVYHLYRR